MKACYCNKLSEVERLPIEMPSELIFVKLSWIMRGVEHLNFTWRKHFKCEPECDNNIWHLYSEIFMLINRVFTSPPKMLNFTLIFTILITIKINFEKTGNLQFL